MKLATLVQGFVATCIVSCIHIRRMIIVVQAWFLLHNTLTLSSARHLHKILSSLDVFLVLFVFSLGGVFSISSGGTWERSSLSEHTVPTLFKATLRISGKPADTFIDMAVRPRVWVTLRAGKTNPCRRLVLLIVFSARIFFYDSKTTVVVDVFIFHDLTLLFLALEFQEVTERCAIMERPWYTDCANLKKRLKTIVVPNWCSKALLLFALAILCFWLEVQCMFLCLCFFRGGIKEQFSSMESI